jgi:3-oxoacyl-[acyl-carrier-protein] synthase II
MIISAMSVISPFGVGTQRFAAGVRAGRSALSAQTGDGASDLPYRTAGVVPDFDPAVLLGTGRTERSLGRPGGLATGAVAMLLREHDLAEIVPERRGLVLGGDLITVDRAMHIMRDSLTQPLPFHVNAKQFPSSVMSHAAAQCAIRFGFKAANATVTAGRLTGLAVLNYARRLHGAGRAPVIVAGAVEDLNPHRQWLTWHGYGDHSPAPLGEGCCVFLTESPESAAASGRQPIAEVLALNFGVVRPGTPQATLADRLARTLRRAGVAPGEVRIGAVSGSDSDAEYAAVASVLGPDARMLCPATLIGDTDGAAAAFQLAAVISAGAAGELAVVTATDPDGQVACGVFRILGP